MTIEYQRIALYAVKNEGVILKLYNGTLIRRGSGDFEI